MEPATHYRSSKGPVLITAIPYPHLKAAHAKLLRDGFGPERQPEFDAMAARLAEMDAMPTDQDRIDATRMAGTQPAAPKDHNLKPPAPKTYDEIKAHIDDLYLEAKNWLDGKPVETQAQADELSRLLGMIKEAEATADAIRKVENEPFDTGKAEVQARFAPLISDTKSVRGKTVLAREACQRALTPWLKKLDDEREAAAKAQRVEADRLAQAARDAVKSDNLEVAESAHDIFAEAKGAERQAKATETDRARVGGGEYRATILRDNWTAEIEDANALLRHFWQTRRAELEAFALKLAMEEVRAGKRTIPGARVWNDRRAA